MAWIFISEIISLRIRKLEHGSNGSKKINAYPSNPCHPIRVPPNNANLAQLVEHFIRNEEVVGSTPIVGSFEDFVICN